MKLKILYWIPRILAILAIVFLMLFSFDVFEGEGSFGMKMTGFLMHNIPTLALTLTLILAWKYEYAGGISFIIFSIVLAIYWKSFTSNPGSLIIVLPFLVTGILFILHRFLSLRKTAQDE